MAAITRWSTGSAVCSAVLRSPPLPSEPLLALRSAPLINYTRWSLFLQTLSLLHHFLRLYYNVTLGYGTRLEENDLLRLL